MKVFLVALLAIAVLGVGAYAVLSTAHVSLPGTAISVSTSTISAETDIYKINVSYPVFGNAKADAETHSIVQKAVDDFKTNPPNPTPVSAKNELDGGYQDVSIGPDLLSALMYIYQYTGGAHGGTVAYGLNYHADGTPYTLDEALSLIGMNLKQVSIGATKQLTDRFQMVQFPEGATATSSNYSTFLIGSSTVSFVFQQYQVEAYAYGMPEVTFARVK
jgi:peptidoglycan-N-acetylmuramic acid deacetylase PdaC-like protein/uncharacterized protein DUF3298